mgnify:CR=1 FL=1
MVLMVIAVSDQGLKVAGDVENATVTGTVMDQGKYRKVIVYKYKRKTGYHAVCNVSSRTALRYGSNRVQENL